MKSHLITATDIQDTHVINIDGEHIGDIKDLMIDMENGYVAYAVLSFGGFLGFGEKLFAIPLEAFDFDLQRRITLNVDKEQLKDAPGFDKKNWPDSADRTFISAVYSHYGYEPYWKKQDV